MPFRRSSALLPPGADPAARAINSGKTALDVVNAVAASGHRPPIVKGGFALCALALSDADDGAGLAGRPPSPAEQQETRQPAPRREPIQDAAAGEMKPNKDEGVPHAVTAAPALGQTVKAVRRLTPTLFWVGYSMTESISGGHISPAPRRSEFSPIRVAQRIPVPFGSLAGRCSQKKRKGTGDTVAVAEPAPLPPFQFTASLESDRASRMSWPRRGLTQVGANKPNPMENGEWKNAATVRLFARALQTFRLQSAL